MILLLDFVVFILNMSFFFDLIICFVGCWFWFFLVNVFIEIESDELINLLFMFLIILDNSGFTIGDFGEFFGDVWFWLMIVKFFWLLLLKLLNIWLVFFFLLGGLNLMLFLSLFLRSILGFKIILLVGFLLDNVELGFLFFWREFLKFLGVELFSLVDWNDEFLLIYTKSLEVR